MRYFGLFAGVTLVSLMAWRLDIGALVVAGIALGAPLYRPGDRKEVILGLLALEYVFVNLAFYIGTQNIVLIKDISAPFLSSLILGVWLSSEIFETGRWTLRPSPVNVPIAAYVLWMAASFLWTVALASSVFEMGRFLAYFVALLATVKFVENWRDLRALFLVHIATGAVVSLYGATQLLGADLLVQMNWIPGWGENVYVSTHGNKNFVVGHLLITGSMTLGYAAYTRSLPAALACLALYLIDGWSISESLTRSGYFGYPAATILIAAGLWWNRRRFVWLEDAWRRNLLRYAGIGVAGALAAALVIGLVLAPRTVLTLDFPPVRNVKNRALETWRYGVGGGYNYVRLVFWKSGLGAAEMRPWTGHGIGTFNKVMPYGRPPWYHRNNVSHNTIYAHNEWVNQITEVGVVGAGLYYWIVAVIAWTLARHIAARREGREYPLLLGLAGGTLAFFFQTTFDVETRWTGNAVTLWHAMGLVFAAASLRLCRDADLAPAPARAPRPAPPPAAPVAGLVIASLAAAGLVFQHWYSARAFRGDIRLRDNMAITEMGAPGDATGTAEEALAGDRYSLTTYYKLAYSYLQRGRADSALWAYRTIQSMAPHYAQIHLNLSVLFLNAYGYVYDGLWEMRRAATIEDNIRNHQSVANQYIAMGDARRAIPHLRRCLRILADDPDGRGSTPFWNREAILASLADAYMQTGRPAVAERQLRAALDLNRDHVPSLIHYARLIRAARPEEAAGIIGRVLAQNPNEPDALLFLAEEALRRGALAEAVTWMDRLAGSLPPPSPGDQGLGRYAQAIHEVASRCLRESPAGVDQVRCLELEGWAWALAGRYGEAVPRLQAAFDATRSPRIAARLAQARARAGQ